MASPLYNKLLEVCGHYLNPQKAADVVSRQISHVSATPDNFGPEHLSQARIKLCTALSLYVPDEAKRVTLVAQINAL